MQDIRGFEATEVETTTSRSKLMGAALVAVGVIGLGAFAYASGALSTPPTPRQQVASNTATAPVPPPAMTPQTAPATTPPDTNPLQSTPPAPQPRASSHTRTPSSDMDQQAKANTAQPSADDESPNNSPPTVIAPPLNVAPPAAAPAENQAPQQSTPEQTPSPPAQSDSAQPPQ